MKNFCKILKNHYNFWIICEYCLRTFISDEDLLNKLKCKSWIKDAPSIIRKSIFWKFTV